MTTRWKRARTMLGAIVYEIRVEKLTFVAGSIAYHAFVSLLPLLLLVLAVISSVGDTSLEAAFISTIEAVLTPGASEVFVGELRSAGQSAGVSIVGLAVLVWGTLRIFRGLDTAFSAIYESESENTFLDQVTDGILVLFTFGVAIAIASFVESLVPNGGSFGWWLNRLVLVFGLMLALGPIYYVFPDEDVSVLEILPGVTFAALGLTVFESVFRLYIDLSSRSPDQSVVAALLVLLTWLYFSGLVILVGAAINAVTSNRSDDVNVEPLFGGVARQSKPQTVARERIVTDVEALEAMLADVDEFTVSTGGRSVAFPRPTKVETKTETSGLLFGNDPVSVTVEWIPQEESESVYDELRKQATAVSDEVREVTGAETVDEGDDA